MRPVVGVAEKQKTLLVVGVAEKQRTLLVEARAAAQAVRNQVQRIFGRYRLWCLHLFHRFGRVVPYKTAE
jgi:hypothetical protein